MEVSLNMISSCSPSFSRGAKVQVSPSPDESTNSIVLDRSLCISCGMCVQACKKVAGQSVLKLAKDPNYKEKRVSTKSGKLLQETNCIKCGQCTLVCGPHALREKDATSEVENVLQNPGNKIIVCQTAPAIRVNLADALGMKPGTVITGKMVTALKKLGFKYVFDTNFGADMTIVEEATELVDRLKNGTGALPMFTSCCPAWVNYVEESAPELIPHLSTAKSPMGMLSAVLKDEYPHLKGVEPKDVYNVAIMPCTAKKDEIERKQLYSKTGVKETDAVITTRELVKMLKKHKINLKSLPDTPFDNVYGESTGAGTIFCNSGGVMEAAIRSAYKFFTGHDMKNYDIPQVRGVENGIKLATVDFDGTPVHFAVAQGIANAMKLIKKIKAKDADVKDVQFVEVMACPGGCVCGGGATRARNKKIMKARNDAVYAIDKSKEERASHHNHELNECYDRFFDGKYSSHKAHEDLHTHLHSRKQ